MLYLAVLIISHINFKNLVFQFLEVCLEVPRAPEISGSEDLLLSSSSFAFRLVLCFWLC